MDQLKKFMSMYGHNILIVDDDQDTCVLLKAIFQSSGFAAKTVYSGEEAVAYVESSKPDAVVLDIMMPSMDGWETYRRIRTYSDSPVLFLTAAASGEYAMRALSQDGSEFMRKPFSAQELIARIEILLRSSKEKHARINLASSEDSFTPNTPITVLIPAYNETRFIGSTVLKACTYADTVIVIDDGSKDNTAEVAEAAGAILVRHTHNMGKGAALNTGFCKARELGAQIVVTLDADGQHMPEELPRVVEPVLAGEADIVIGSRYISRQSKVPRHRIWGHWFFNQLTHLSSGISASDSQSGYRAYSAAALDVLSFCSDGFSVESEMQFIAHEKGLRLKEVPITILYTDKPKRSVMKQGLTVLGGVLKLTGQYHPLIYYGMPGLLLISLGLILGLEVITIIKPSTNTALISLLFTVIGTMLYSMGIMLHAIRGLIIDELRMKNNRER